MSVKEKLQACFATDLPGAEAQEKMAPSLRSLPGDVFRNGSQARKSAVMIVLHESEGRLSSLYIKRPEYDGHHSGQVAFPGGKADETDESLLYTAVRECMEEVGLEISPGNVLGQLTPLHIPVSNMDVYPFVAYVPKLPALKLDEREVAYAFSSDISELLNPANRKTKESSYKGHPITVPYYSVNDEQIWGATAMITAELIALVGQSVAAS